MNKNILLEMIFGAVLLLFTACTQDELTDSLDALPPGKYPLEIGSVTISAEVDSQPWGADAPQTRVTENNDRNSSTWQWNGTEQIGVQLYPDDDGTAIYTLTSDKTLTTDKTLYWRNKLTRELYAWYPVAETVPLANQSGGLAYVLKGKGSGDYQSSSVELSFSHQLAKVRVRLEGEKAGNVNGVKIESYTSCTNTNGTVKGNETSVGEITMYKVDDKTYEANVVPEKTIEKFKVNGGDWVVLSTPVTPLEGKVHEITIDVKKASLKPVDGKFTVNAGDDVLIKDYSGPASIVVNGNGNATITLDNVKLTTEVTTMEINSGATVTLNVVGTKNSLTSTNGSGIGAHDNCTITSKGNGIGNSKLTVSSGDGHNVGVGFITVAGTATYNYGDIKISDVTLSVTASTGGGGTAGAAIGVTGSVAGWANRINCGNITINNSNVTANSKGGAGIGTGVWSMQHLSMGVISIAGSTVTVTSGDDGYGWSPACIGMGVVECGTAANGGVTIQKIKIEKSKLNLTTNGRCTYKVGKGTVHSGTATITDGIFVDGNNKGKDGWNP